MTLLCRLVRLLKRLETSSPEAISAPNANVSGDSQMMLFSGQTNHLAKAIEKLDLDNMSPMDALKTLKELQEKADKI